MENYDLIFLDIQIPGIDGYETARSLLPELQENTMKNGINDCPGKPFLKEDLIQKIRSLVP